MHIKIYMNIYMNIYEYMWIYMKIYEYVKVYKIWTYGYMNIWMHEHMKMNA